ncbi:MAG TPA: MFS transporter [Arthrobacter bacterium]|nr:MFS transporter [Arthrobacter sp.]HCC38678.1 MFS transporter [Arthrobacter sp.]
METVARPWLALWSLVVGFFMILIDTTIVFVANPSIGKALDADITAVVWVTSAYLLSYAVLLLIAGRLGDRFGPKRVYVAGLAVFTLASLWCGLSGDIAILILARTVQGVGGALMTPQTMAVITRIFPPDRRGAAMGLWGATAGMAILVGPILGGVLVDSLGWEWIFFINVPIGVVAFLLVMRNVPTLKTHSHSFDVLGVLLSALAMFLIVFGIQEGQTYKWGTINDGPFTVWSLIIAGLVVMVVFIGWQWWLERRGGEPLLPLSLFRDRNFALGNAGITVVGFSITAYPLASMIFYQVALGLTPTQSALLLIPMAVLTGALSPVVGKLIDRVNPRWFAVAGMLLFTLSIYWTSVLMTPDTPVWMFLLPSAVQGLGMACIFGPIANATTRNLAPRQAGAGSGVFNTTRQIGSVLGAAAMAALIQARIVAEFPPLPPGQTASPQGFGAALPEALHAPFATAMGQSVLLPAAVLLIGALTVAFLAKPRPMPQPGDDAAAQVPRSAEM